MTPNSKYMCTHAHFDKTRIPIIENHDFAGRITNRLVVKSLLARRYACQVGSEIERREIHARGQVDKMVTPSINRGSDATIKHRGVIIISARLVVLEVG